MITQEWFSYDCPNCLRSAVLDIRINNDDAEPPVIACPVCGRPLDFRGRWPATRDGYGSRGDGGHRPSWDAYFMDLAHVVSARATCSRRKVGAVLALENRILTTGYCGSPSGRPHCTDEGVGCKLDGDPPHCVRSVHAELNALAVAARHGISTRGATLYLTTNPCVRCANALLSAGVVRVVIPEADYQDVYGWTGLDVVKVAGVPV